MIIIYDGIEFTIRRGRYENCKLVNGKCIKTYLHRYIYEKFIGKIPKVMNVHHLDHNPLNNSIDNLCLMTRAEHSKMHNIGKNMSEQTKLKISISKQNPSNETRLKMSNSAKGRKHTKETKLKISKIVNSYWLKRKLNNSNPSATS